MLTVIHLNGPINSGKSTIGCALSGPLPDAAFIDGDDHDAPDGVPLAVRIEAALRRIEARIADAEGHYLIVAYPLDQGSHDRLSVAAASRGACFRVVTLAPPLAVALSDHGARTLNPHERARIIQMYEEGYHTRLFSHVVLDTTGRTPEQSALHVAEAILAIT
jgi:hypothetical protein